jgi:hypothetical protein
MITQPPSPVKDFDNIGWKCDSIVQNYIALTVLSTAHLLDFLLPTIVVGKRAHLRAERISS